MSKIGFGQIYVDGDAESYMLVQTDQSEVCLIRLKNGNRWRKPTQVLDATDLSEAEWADVSLRLPTPVQCISTPLPSAPSSYLPTNGTVGPTVPYVGGSYVWASKQDFPECVIDVIDVSENYVDYVTSLGNGGSMTRKHFSKHYVPVTKRVAPAAPSMEYTALKGDFVALKQRVNTFIEDGWVPAGGMSAISTPLGIVYLQSMTRTKEQK